MSQVCLVDAFNLHHYRRFSEVLSDEALDKTTETLVLFVAHRGFLTRTWSLTH